MIIMVIVLSGVVATTAMTVFSYLLSRGQSEQFREPELLNSLIARSDIIEPTPFRNGLEGWALHYAIGSMFMLIFHAVWKYTASSPDLISGGAMGLVAGVVGILGWHAMFALSGNPPQITLKRFYLHLLVAHIIFGISGALVSMTVA